MKNTMSFAKAHALFTIANQQYNDLFAQYLNAIEDKEEKEIDEKLEDKEIEVMKYYRFLLNA